MNAFPLQTYHHYYFFNSVDFSPSCLLEKITNYVKGSVFYNIIITGHSSSVAKLMFQPGKEALKNVSCNRLTCLMRPNRTLKYIELEHRIMHVIKPSRVIFFKTRTSKLVPETKNSEICTRNTRHPWECKQGFCRKKTDKTFF